MSEQPKTVEPVPVQLTRIEGVVNLIAYQMAEVKTEVTNLAGRVTAIELAQATATGSSGFLKQWLPTLLTAALLAVALGFGVKFGG
jgi:hypothetical protein